MLPKKAKNDPASNAKAEGPEAVAASDESIDATEVTRLLEVVAECRRGLPALDEVARSAYRTKVSEEQSETLGARTQASGVLKDAVAWLPLLVKAVRDHAGQIPGLPARRLSYYCDCAEGLGHAIQVQNSARDDHEATQHNLELIKPKADAARNDLLERLQQIPDDGDASAQKQLAKATGSTKTPGDTAESLAELADLAATWLKKGDEARQVRLEDWGVTPELVSGAKRTAKELLKAIKGKTLDGPVRAGDTAQVNRAEGRVLSEMRYALNCLKGARDRGVPVTLPVPGKATQGVLSPKRNTVKEEPAPAPAPALVAESK